jgi:hypothetical protein
MMAEMGDGGGRTPDMQIDKTWVMGETGSQTGSHGVGVMKERQLQGFYMND